MEKRAPGEMGEPAPDKAPIRQGLPEDGVQQQRPNVHGGGATNANHKTSPEKIRHELSHYKIGGEVDRRTSVYPYLRQVVNVSKNSYNYHYFFHSCFLAFIGVCRNPHFMVGQMVGQKENSHGA
jgi:hypothetical protein